MGAVRRTLRIYMKPWKPSLPDTSSFEEAVSVGKDYLDKLEAIKKAEETLSEAKDSHRLAQEEITKVVASKKIMRDSLHTLRDSLTVDLKECDGAIEDLLHYLEIYDMNAAYSSRITKLLREARRQKRRLQDEKCLAVAALDDLYSRNSDKLHYHDHLARISGLREYHPRSVTLAEALSLTQAGEDINKED